MAECKCFNLAVRLPGQVVKFLSQYTARPLFQFFGFRCSLLFTYLKPRARIFKLLRNPRIDSKKPVSPGCVLCVQPAGPVRQPHPTRFLAPLECLKTPALDCGVDRQSNQKDRIQHGVLYRETVCCFIQVFFCENIDTVMGQQVIITTITMIQNRSQL